ncbi:hypothetical protein [Sphingobium sp. YR768]|uniref:hypothetical protein n=1 Tax=Sphingobium sp. YR768 TaxID=1884365 RepID=UPI0008D2300E|nr:hypothetical protein SAMN05518866_1454 [Sphingobium sp. YR768]
MDPLIGDVTVFTKNRARLLAGDVVARFLSALIGQSRVQALLSDDQFSVDGTLIEAWTSIKSFRPKDDSASDAGQNGHAKAKGQNAERDFLGEKWSNVAHASTTDPDPPLFKKARGRAAKLSHGP